MTSSYGGIIFRARSGRAVAPGPLTWAGFVLVESFELSGNLPLHTMGVRQDDGWRNLADADGPVLVLPLERDGDRGRSIGYAHRAAGVPLGADLFVPPGSPPPAAWWEFKRSLDEESPEASLERVRGAGYAAVAHETTPWSVPALLPPPLEAALTAAFGEPLDYGSVRVWWIVSPERVPPAREHPERWRWERG